eukprot:CAMPEP_0179445334 /NCGR_PEP_ID=MMETSP0799-20121207/28777_1 /TAXON_ID=46947 /ORGANISM="Geminigera cryophila, Strain CCMP2564" /LENGTH=156 /DNA_ID=CAMNT_0021233267 /DNA_START=189 /DNA_END=659 /DNA_ORIENTATION=-
MPAQDMALAESRVSAVRGSQPRVSVAPAGASPPECAAIALTGPVVVATVANIGWGQKMMIGSLIGFSRSGPFHSAGSATHNPALGFSVAVNSRSDRMVLPGDHGQPVPPMHILRQAMHDSQGSFLSVGSRKKGSNSAKIRRAGTKLFHGISGLRWG